MRPAFLLLALTTALCATQAAGEHEEVVDLLQRWWKRAEFWEGLGHPSLGTTALDAGGRRRSAIESGAAQMHGVQEGQYVIVAHRHREHAPRQSRLQRLPPDA